MMKLAGVTGAILTVGLAGAVFAHSGATGVVKQRMDSMAAIEKAVKAVMPVMRGQASYDPTQVKAFANTVKRHSGEAMTALFPEGSDGMPSEAKPEIWRDWEEFSALADQLHTLSEGLALAADNGLMEGALAGGAAMMGGQNMMGGGNMMSGGNMMGSGGMMGGQAMMGNGMIAALRPEELAEMPAGGVFMMMGQTCSACHTKFRTESK